VECKKVAFCAQAQAMLSKMLLKVAVVNGFSVSLWIPNVFQYIENN